MTKLEILPWHSRILVAAVEFSGLTIEHSGIYPTLYSLNLSFPTRSLASPGSCLFHDLCFSHHSASPSTLVSTLMQLLLILFSSMCCLAMKGQKTAHIACSIKYIGEMIDHTLN